MWRARSIQALLSAPNPDDPLAENVARHWKDNEAEAVATGAPPVARSVALRSKCACGALRRGAPAAHCAGDGGCVRAVQQGVQRSEAWLHAWAQFLG